MADLLPCPACPYCGKPMMAHETDWTEPPEWSFHCLCLHSGHLTRDAAYEAYSRPTPSTDPAYVLVPREPTEAMLKALAMALCKANNLASLLTWDELPDGTKEHAFMLAMAVYREIASVPDAEAKDDLLTWLRSLPAEVAPKLREAYEFYLKHHGGEAAQKVMEP